MAGTNSPSFDLTGDGDVDVDDLSAWLGEAGAANLGPGLAHPAGDANLDGVVDVPDFNLWNSRKFSAAGGWRRGDFDADGATDVSDFNLWNGNKFTSSADVTAVPESRAANLSWLGATHPAGNGKSANVVSGSCYETNGRAVGRYRRAELLPQSVRPVRCGKAN